MKLFATVFLQSAVFNGALSPPHRTYAYVLCAENQCSATDACQITLLRAKELTVAAAAAAPRLAFL